MKMPLTIRMSVEQIISMLALILSVIAIVFSYKGIKVTKYIETITNQRIKWIETLRNDLSRIVTFAVLYKRFKEDAEATAWWVESDEYFRLDPQERSDTDEEIENIKDKRKRIISEVKKSENINVIELAIIRLNETDDIVLIQKLEALKQAFLLNKEEIVTDDFIIELRNEIKKLIKVEWERVKLEVRKGGNINGWKGKTKRSSFWK